MKRVPRPSGFTMPELLIAMVGSTIIIGALLLSSIGLQKAFRASELFAASQADQRRLIDYLGRDLRRAVGIAIGTSVNGSDATRMTLDPLIIEGEKALRLTLPGYYKSNAPADQNFDQQLPVMMHDRRVDYGTATGQAATVPVIFRKVFLVEEGCVCFVRQEAETQQVIVRRAEDLSTRITLAPDGTSCVVDVWFTLRSGSTRPLVATHDQIMLRNNRID